MLGEKEACAAASPHRYMLSYIQVVDRFYIALFSALEQTYCALVACESK